MRIRVTKLFNFEMAHALQQYDGACRNIHGHTYTLEVTISGEPIIDRTSAKLGMVMDFGDLKKLVNEAVIDKFDHALVAQKGHLNSLIKEEARDGLKTIQTDFQPTSENLIAYFADTLIGLLPGHIILERLKLHETKTSYAEWLRSDQ